MTVAELIEMLKGEDPEAEVHFSYTYGDHWRTVVAPKVDCVSQGYVKHSAYHSMDVLIDEDDYDDENKEMRDVVILSR